MYHLIKQIKTFSEKLSSRKLGAVFFVGLIKRFDVEDKYDLLVIGDWYSEKKEKEQIKFLFNLLKDSTQGDLTFLANIVLPSPDEDFVFDIDAVAHKLEFDVENEVLFFKGLNVSIIPIVCNFDNFLYKRKKVSKVRLSSF